VPISLFGTCAVMYVLDYSINNMTLLALTLSSLRGRRCHRHAGKHRPPHRTRMKPYEAALKARARWLYHHLDHLFADRGVHPVLLMGGIVGRVFREFAVTVSVASWFPASYR